jgi:hypothetical protein
MISIGGMIGAGLFVSSSAAIAATGPATTRGPERSRTLPVHRRLKT